MLNSYFSVEGFPRSVFAGLIALMLFLPAGAAVSATAAFVGSESCGACHTGQTALWSDSHHDLAMQPANADTVLGDFDNARFTHFGVTSLFSIKDGKYRVRTEGPDGELHDYEIKYTFGVDPLQQYLVEFPGGRLQALGIAWDSRPAAAGGQRWFHLYPDERIAHNDELHWTRDSHNWNSMCAECHSTHLEKRYDAAKKTFDTRWSEVDVACEACHGPGSNHLLWAERKPGWQQFDKSLGLTVALDERKGVEWTINEKTGNAQRSERRGSDREVQMCARCHARRSPITDGYVHGEPFLGHYLPRLLDAGMYHADGQIDDEVYVYGSFIQSRMYHAGVTCSDCHEPHSLQLRSPGNGVCLQCHAAAKYDSSAHHFHESGTDGARCAECHMPPKTYMVVDPRHDHSMRIPRPDLSVKLGTPNACNNCHVDKDSAWAAQQVKAWYGHTPSGFQNYAGALAAGRNDEPGAGSALATLIRDADTPDIARATALSLMRPYLSAETADVLTSGVRSNDPAVRAATAALLESAPLDWRVRLGFPLLSDPVRAVRIEAARVLAAIPAGDLPAEQQALLESGIQDYIAAQQAMAERPEAQTNLGNLYAARGQAQRAQTAYETAIDIDPRYMPAYVNLADLHRSRGDETAAEKTLRRAIAVEPEAGDARHALGLVLVRQQRAGEAVEALRLAAELQPDNVRYVYVYAVALHSTGKPEEAVRVLTRAQQDYPGNTDILNALVAFHRDLGNEAEARDYAEKLRALPR